MIKFADLEGDLRVEMSNNKQKICIQCKWQTMGGMYNVFYKCIRPDVKRNIVTGEPPDCSKEREGTVCGPEGKCWVSKIAKS